MKNETQILQAISLPDAETWESFFETFRQQQYQQLAGCQTEADRLKVQSNVVAFNLVEHVFQRIRIDKKIVLDKTAK